jgi:hypothetical protein
MSDLSERMERHLVASQLGHELAGPPEYYPIRWVIGTSHPRETGIPLGWPRDEVF